MDNPPKRPKVTVDLMRIHDAMAARYVLHGRICLAVAWVCGFILIAALGISFVHAHDAGQWQGSDPAVVEWYQSLKQPDNPNSSCCGAADAYYCDEIHVKNGQASCMITDEREDGPLNRPHVDIGTEIEIPNSKLKWDRGNPTGHSIVFLSRNRYVYCFVQGGGI